MYWKKFSNTSSTNYIHVENKSCMDVHFFMRECLLLYLKALHIKPEYEEAHHNLGSALVKEGRMDDAIKHYLEALRIKPNFAEAHNNLGLALFRKGNTEGAIDHFREALRIRPLYVQASNNLKKVLMSRQRSP